MGFEDALKKPLSWMRNEPSVFLLAVINWLPGLLMLPVIFSMLPTVQRLMTQSNNDLTVLITQHGGELFQAFLPFLLVGLVVVIISALVKVVVSLALANVASQLREQKPLSLSDSLTAAKNRWVTLALAALATTGLLIAFILVMILVVLLAVAVLVIPVLGILIALLLGLLFLSALVVFSFASSAVFILLPVIVSQTKDGAWTSVKNAFAFANRFKLQCAGLVVIVALVQTVFGQVAIAGLPHLWLVVFLSMLVELVVFTWTNLFAAELWFQYVGQPTPQAANKTAPSTPKAASEKTGPNKPDAPTTVSKLKPKAEDQPIRRTLKVGIAPKKTKK